MAVQNLHREPAKRLAPARVSPESYEAMDRLAKLNGRSAGAEYRAAVDAWIKRNRSKLEAA